MLNPSIVKPPGPLDPKRIPESHIAEQLWSSADDQLLRSLIDIYHNNWSLIADAFNTSRISVSTDRRTAWDCYYRYTLPPAKQDAETPTPVTNLSNRPKRQVAMNASEAALSNAQLNLESKKRKRRMVMQEAVRKVAKKRDAVAKAASVF
jgi:chromatin modification-related protein VID21